MSPAQFDELLKAVKNSQGTDLSQLWPVIVVVAAAAYFFWYIRNYVAEKAKNAATREDINAITRQIEAARAEYSRQLESLRGAFQLHAAAMEKRLQAHQDALYMWDKLLGSATDRTQGPEVWRECRTWWFRNCIYLSKEARDAFFAALQAAGMHRNLLNPLAERGEIESNWNTILRAGDIIMESAGLPPLPEEAKPLTPSTAGN